MSAASYVPYRRLAPADIAAFMGSSGGKGTRADFDGDLPVNPDGGPKSFGHPVGASGLRMFFECWLQMRHEAPPGRQIATTDRGLAMTHNLGGYPGEMVSFVSVVGSKLG